MEARFSATVQTGPGAHPASCTMGTGSFPGVKSGRGVTLTPHPLLVPWSRKGRAIPLLPLCAVRPVQSLSACTRVTFTFSFTFVYVQNFKYSKEWQAKGLHSNECTTDLRSSHSLCTVKSLCKHIDTSSQLVSVYCR